LTLRAVERATGVSNANLSQLESGKIRQPSPLVLHNLEKRYQDPFWPDSACSEHMEARAKKGPDTNGTVSCKPLIRNIYWQPAALV
jgi:transcriptional regulator with XRE-family HTH domain